MEEHKAVECCSSGVVGAVVRAWWGFTLLAKYQSTTSMHLHCEYIYNVINTYLFPFSNKFYFLSSSLSHSMWRGGSEQKAVWSWDAYWVQPQHWVTERPQLQRQSERENRKLQEKAILFALSSNWQDRACEKNTNTTYKADINKKPNITSVSKSAFSLIYFVFLLV